MTRLAVSIAVLYHTNCRIAVSFFQARQSLTMFFMGVALLFVGLELLADAQSLGSTCVPIAADRKNCELPSHAEKGTTNKTIRVNDIDKPEWAREAWAQQKKPVGIARPDGITITTIKTNKDDDPRKYLSLLEKGDKAQKAYAYPHNIDLGWYQSLLTTKGEEDKLPGDSEALAGVTIPKDKEIRGDAETLKSAGVIIDDPGKSKAQNPEASGELLPAEDIEAPYDDTLVRNSVGNLYKFIEGSFGALLVVVTGIGTIIAAVVGAYKVAFAMFVTSVGAFILRSYVSLFFGNDYDDYNATFVP